MIRLQDQLALLIIDYQGIIFPGNPHKPEINFIVRFSEFGIHSCRTQHLPLMTGDSSEEVTTTIFCCGKD